jgi:hypothetical protein
LDNLKMESETSRVKHSEEIEGLKKTSQEMHGLLRQLLSFNQGCESWRIVQKFTHRHLWNVTENENEETPMGLGLSYQDETCAGFVNQGKTMCKETGQAMMKMKLYGNMLVMMKVQQFLSRRMMMTRCRVKTRVRCTILFTCFKLAK